MSASDRQAEVSGMDRRRFLRNAATVAWAAPAIMTMMTQSAGAAATCIENGQACTLNSACCSGTCLTTCQGLPAGSPCTAHNQCASGKCQGTTVKTCQA